MKKIVLISLLSALTMSAFAQNAHSDATVTVSAAPEKNTAFPMTTADYERFAYIYELSNGKTLTLFTRVGKKYAVLEDEPSREVIATSSHSFVTLDRHLEMTLNLQDNGDVSGELLIRTPKTVSSNDSGPVEHYVFVAGR
ncbi:MAG: hypothetical protein JO269_11305 [Burkholderiaceae bacterium]|nr:hypothetical protein [Burkholderiaceae bacterium]